MVLAHEQFHQLADMLGGDLPSQPMWIEESLAQFYALRALKAAYSKNVVVNEIWSRFIDPQRPVEHGFITLEHQYLANGDPETYSLFYSQGATFWAQMDAAIQNATSQQLSLDDFVVEILTSPPQPDKQLPIAIRKKLLAIDKTKIQDLLAHYVDQ